MIDNIQPTLTADPDVEALWDLMGNMAVQRRAEWIAAKDGPSFPQRMVLNLLWMLEDDAAKIKRLQAEVIRLGGNPDV